MDLRDSTLACRYFDGRSSRPWTAAVAIEDAGVHVVGDGVDRVVDLRDLRFAPATDRGPARLSFAGGGLCEFDDRVAADALFARLGHRRSRAERLASRTSHAIAVTVAFVVVMGLLYRWGLPWLADEAVALAPHRWDVAFGNNVLQTFDQRGIFKPTGLSQARRDTLAARFTSLRLPPGGPGAHDHPQIRVEFRRLGAPNAFALPGDIVVVTDEIVALSERVPAAGDDALMTIMGHEIGHVEHRDAMRQLARNALSSIVAAWYFGDVSNAAAVVAGGIGTLSYSRAAEHRADLYALRTMQLNGIPTRGAATLFRQMEAWRPARDASRKPSASDPKEAGRDGKEHDGNPKDGSDAREAKSDPGSDAKPDVDPIGRRKRPRLEAPEYLSTHPATEGRIELFESGVVPERDADD